MKIRQLFCLLLLAGVFASCSSDDDAKPSVENAKFSFSGTAKAVEAPSALATKDDPYAQQTVGYIEMVNSMATFISAFEPPSGATKTSTEISAPNGRVNGTASSVVVWTWSDPNYGTIAYQIKDLSDKYTFEVFFKPNDTNEWLRYLYAEEQKDKSSGMMEMYSDSEVYLRWDWARSGDNFTFTYSSPVFDFEFVMVVNTKTKAGSVNYFIGGAKVYEIVWTSQGAGSWKYYENGVVVEEGTWD